MSHVYISHINCGHLIGGMCTKYGLWMALEGKWKVLGRSQHVSLCSSWSFLGNGDNPIPIRKDGCSQEIFNVKKELRFPYVDTLVYTITSIFDLLSTEIFLWTPFLTSRCITILYVILKYQTMILMHIFILTIVVLNQL